ncbi:MAG TPA: hypothetical protein VFB26_08560 [Gaiellaceae bacterium]|nr:hypothetical protein [Gaiellaceae bacterium]
MSANPDGRVPRRLALAATLALALGAGAACAHPVAAAAAPARVAVVVVPSLDLEQAARRGAVGLLVPGAGASVTRAGALSSLVRGRVVTSLLGGVATGAPTIRLARTPAATTIYVTLPPPGRTHNVRRYPLAIVGPGYPRGSLLVSRSTRIPGLVSIADVAPTAVALERGERPRIRARARDDAARALRSLDRRLTDAHDTRSAGIVVLVAWTLALSGLGLLLRSALLARAGVLAVPSALAVAFGLSLAGARDPSTAAWLLALLTGAAALAAAAAQRAFVPVLLAFLGAALGALAIWPDVNALSAIGPHPDGGGRYYGITNQVETLLLAPILAAAALLPPAALVPLGALAVMLVGWSETGADGGGTVVVLVALAALWARRAGVRPTPARVAVGAGAVVAVAAALAALDLLTGGSSHVTDALGAGPGSLLGDLGHRLHVSWKGLTATAQASVTAGATSAVLVGVALLRPRAVAVDALLVALVASLLVNDTPADVLAYGALVAVALRVQADVSGRRRAPSSPSAPPARASRSRRSAAARDLVAPR